MTEQTSASAPLDLGEFRTRRTFTTSDGGTYLIGNNTHTLSAGETIELPEDVSTIYRVSNVPLTIAIHAATGASSP